MNDEYRALTPHPNGDEQYVIRWNRAARQWQRWYFTPQSLTINRFTETPEVIDVPYNFSPYELARLKRFKSAFGPWYTDSPGPSPTDPTPPPPDPPGD